MKRQSRLLVKHLGNESTRRNISKAKQELKLKVLERVLDLLTTLQNRKMANPLERMRQVEVFKLDYCPLCGCVLFRPQGMLEPTVYCYRPGCSYRFQAKELRGKVITHQQVTVPKKRKYTGKAENQKKAQGPTMVINCDNCGETEASYYTRQLRSADEGQTIFYKCLKCGKETKEDS